VAGRPDGIPASARLSDVVLLQRRFLSGHEAVSFYRPSRGAREGLSARGIPAPRVAEDEEALW